MLFWYLVQPLGIEPSSTILQTAAMTTSAKVAFLYLERATGIEPATEGWKPTVLPLNYTRIIETRYCFGHDRRILTFIYGFAIRYIVTLSYRGSIT